MLVFQTSIISVNEFDIILFKTTFFLNAYWSINVRFNPNTNHHDLWCLIISKDFTKERDWYIKVTLIQI